MTTSKISDDELWEAYILSGKNKSGTAKTLGMSRGALRSRLITMQGRGYNENTVYELEVDDGPDEVDLEELLERRKKEFIRVKDRQEYLKKIKCKVKIDGPIGILFHGDPHLDDPGTDLVEVEKNSNMTTKTPGLFAASVGDMTNNWVGRLARLYAEQATTHSESFALGEWFVNTNKWLFLVGGNHDAWSGAQDPFKWICRNGGHVYESSEVRMELNFPKGAPLIVNCRHDFQGHSMWNPGHGVGKAAQLGPPDEIFVNGHKHVNGYMIMKQPTGEVSHCIQVSSYKEFDRFAKERGFRDQTFAPAVVTIINPVAEKAIQRVQVFHDVEHGVDYLKWLRSKY